MNKELKNNYFKRCIAILKKVAWFILNPRLLLCYGLAWLLTNGWAYATSVLGTYFDLEWLVVVASSYLALIWLPFTPEKIITVGIAMVLLRLLFPKDEKTLRVLEDLYSRAKVKYAEWKNQRKN